MYDRFTKRARNENRCILFNNGDIEDEFNSFYNVQKLTT